MSGEVERLCIMHVITSLDTGAAESMLAKLVRSMNPSRFDNRVVSLMEPGPVAKDILAAGVPVESLGLRKIRQSVERPDTPDVRGMVFRARHLLDVEETG